MKLLNKYWGLLLVVIVSLLPLASLLHPGLPITHDGQDHIARIANFYQSLSEGNVIPRWAENLNWGYGHPILMFLYPFSSYWASVLHIFGFSLVTSVKIVFGFAFILSGITMYVWLNEFLGEEAAAAGAILYNFAPYRFIDLAVRGAIGEHVAFIFPPLILYFLLKISKEKSFNRFYFSFAALSIAGLVLAHNAICIIFLPAVLIYGLYLIWLNQNKKSLLYQFVSVLILGFCLSAFFIIPAYIEGKYTLRDIVTGSEVLSRFVNLKDLIYGPWSYGQSGVFSVQVGILSWIAVLASIITFFRTRNKSIKALIILLLFYFAASIFIMLPISEPIWKSLSILQKFQFPWRFLSVSIFAAATLGAIVISDLNKKLKLIVAITVIVLILVTTFTYWQPKGYQYKPERFYSGVYFGTTDTGESAPIWSVRFMEHTASAPAELINGAATIRQTLRNSTHHQYEINASAHSRIRENTLYFPGWKVYIDGKIYQGVQYQDPANRGLITYYVPAGKHVVDIVFGDTRLVAIANYISFAAAIVLVGILFSTFLSKKKS